MMFSPVDFILPVGMAVMFGLYRYTYYLRSDPQNAKSRVAADAAKGAAGLLAILLVYKFILPR